MNACVQCGGRFTPSLPAVRLIPHLADAAKEAREDRQVKREPVAAAADKSTDTIRRFEQGKQGAAIDRIVEAYAEATGLSVFDLWDEALRRAREAASTSRGTGADSKAVREGLDRLGTEQQPGRSSRAKGTRRAGG